MKRNPMQALESYYEALDTVQAPARQAPSLRRWMLHWTAPLAMGAALAMAVAALGSWPIDAPKTTGPALESEFQSAGLALADFGLAPKPKQPKLRAEVLTWTV